MSIKVLSVGGSIVAPEYPDVDFVSKFVALVKEYLEGHKGDKLIFVIGGGGPARIYQNAFRSVTGESPVSSAQEADWIGIMATRLNAQFVKACFGGLCRNEVVTDPTANIDFSGSILVAAGWKPGFSTDADAVFLAKKFNAKTVINLSNIEKVYTDDPKTNPDAKPLDSISWADFRKMMGDTWSPGKNTPFDPIASREAQQAGITVICAGGRNIENTKAILDDKPFKGTKIG